MKKVKKVELDNWQLQNEKGMPKIRASNIHCIFNETYLQTHQFIQLKRAAENKCKTISLPCM